MKGETGMKNALIGSIAIASAMLMGTTASIALTLKASHSAADTEPYQIGLTKLAEEVKACTNGCNSGTPTSGSLPRLIASMMLCTAVPRLRAFSETASGAAKASVSEIDGSAHTAR